MAVFSVDEYISKHPEWNKELVLLRKLMLNTEMEETIKWGAPTYTVNNKNVIGLGAFKSYVGIWFFNGALLKDTGNKLINAQEGKTVAMRQWRFTTINEIDRKLVSSYISEAVQNQKDGKTITPPKTEKPGFPSELTDALSNDSSLKKAFGELTSYKQKEYAEYLLEAKRENTKLKRLEKIIPMIKKGIGLNDKYRK
ncbi:DUF1801 domain-containing protein [Zhouia spongiae]|uniref:DUF1801 domain-containing protein n=1 Tax=Zhouia spongiae TaxID=2202721 RepID=A0ABY3YM47_9FLAO|nr:DUF1801 domain-containing protein [Zhouia spongiae]UNY98870.1 DUF1801 domain-containing protein [Zhouia spongiae]